MGTSEPNNGSHEVDMSAKAFWAAMLGGSNFSGNEGEMAAWPWHPFMPFHPGWHPGWHPPPWMPFHPPPPPPPPPHWYAANESQRNTSELNQETREVDMRAKAFWAAMLGSGNFSGNESEMAAWPWHPLMPFHPGWHPGWHPHPWMPFHPPPPPPPPPHWYSADEPHPPPPPPPPFHPPSHHP